MNVCAIAAFWYMGSRGCKPDVTGDVLLRSRSEDAMAWFRGIASGMISPAGIIDSTPNTKEGAPAFVTGTMGNVVGGYAAPTTIAGNPTNAGGVKTYPFTGTVPGRRGW